MRTGASGTDPRDEDGVMPELTLTEPHMLWLAAAAAAVAAGDDVGVDRRSENRIGRCVAAVSG